MLNIVLFFRQMFGFVMLRLIGVNRLYLLQTVLTALKLCLATFVGEKDFRFMSFTRYSNVLLEVHVNQTVS